MVFSIGVATAAARAAENDGALNGLTWLVRIGLYLGLFAGVGGAFFGAWIAPARGAAAMIATAVFVGLFSALASLGLQGLDLLGLPLRAIFALGTLESGVGHQPRTGAADLGCGFGRRFSRAAKQVGGRRPHAVGACDGRRRAFTGCERARRDRAAAMVDPAHVIFAWRWSRVLGGALLPLVWIAWRREDGLLVPIDRFSRVAGPVVGVLVLAGLGLASSSLRASGAGETRYGLILSIKLALVVVLLGLAALNRFA